MKTTTINSVIATARGADAFVPMLTGQIPVTTWAKALATESVTTKSGREISAARSALNSAQFAMTNMAMSLRCATELGMLPFTQAVSETKRIYSVLDALRVGFAGVRNEAHRELVVAEVTLAVKDGAFAALQSEQDNEPYTEEELLEMGLNWEQIEEFLALQAANVSLGQSHLMDSDGAMAEDEGEAIVAVHDPIQLWDMELRDIKYAESSAARVALIGKNWPTSNVAWDIVVARLADTWDASIEYADDKEAAIKKVERRAAALADLHANPMMARWVINHVTRRVFRDLVMLDLKAEDVQGRWDWAERQAFNEERYNVPGRATRHNMGEQVELERKAFLYYEELNEAELGTGSAYAHMDESGVVLRATMNTAMSLAHKEGNSDNWSTMMDTHEEDVDAAINRDRRWYMAQLEAIEAIKAKLNPLYKELRALDLSLAKLWEIFADEGRPAHPPVYWNMEQAFQDVEQAKAAIRIEAAMAKQKAREAEGDALVKAAAMVADMLGL